jgi:predicted nucleotidyltransferase
MEQTMQNEIEDVKKKIAPILKTSRDKKKAGLFGSVVRGELTEK